MSTYRERLILWPELALDAAFFAIVVGWGRWGGVIGLGMAIGARLLVRRFGPNNSLRIDAAGLHFPRMTVPWSNLRGIAPARPPLSWAEGLALKQPLTWPWWLSPGKVTRISLSRYERNWRHGRIGEDISRWAPDLLQERDRAHA